MRQETDYLRTKPVVTQEEIHAQPARPAPKTKHRGSLITTQRASIPFKQIKNDQTARTASTFCLCVLKPAANYPEVYCCPMNVCHCLKWTWQNGRNTHTQKKKKRLWHFWTMSFITLCLAAARSRGSKLTLVPAKQWHDNEKLMLHYDMNNTWVWFSGCILLWVFCSLQSSRFIYKREK